MAEDAPDLSVRLTRNAGWYSVPLSFGVQGELILVALLNPPQPVSLISPLALDQLQRWEFASLAKEPRYLLTGATIQGQRLPDFAVQVHHMSRPARWDIIIGANFFDLYTNFRLHIPTSQAGLTRD